jgi:biotin carboxyl carrier protein
MEEQKITTSLVINDTVYTTKLTNKFKMRKAYVAPDPKKILAFIPGIVRDIAIKKGQTVKEGEQLLILEAIKMKNILTSPLDGKIKDIKVECGNMVLKDQLLIELE